MLGADFGGGVWLRRYLASGDLLWRPPPQSVQSSFPSSEPQAVIDPHSRGFSVVIHMR